MEAKLYLILNEFQDLKLKVEGLENKEETSRNDLRDDRRENTNRRRDNKDDITDA